MSLKSTARVALLFSNAVLAASVLAQDKFVEGQHYQAVSSPQRVGAPDKPIEIAVVFMYGCPHCFNFEPHLQEWIKTNPSDVTVVRLPASFTKLAELHAKAYYSAESLGVIDKMHDAIFRAIHVEKRDLSTPEQLRDFFREHGVEPIAFDKTLASQDVESKVHRTDALIKGYGVRVTPTVVVNGKYLTTLQMAGSYETWFEVIDALIARERREPPKLSANK